MRLFILRITTRLTLLFKMDLRFLLAAFIFTGCAEKKGHQVAPESLDQACESIGVYSWDQKNWRDSDSKLLQHLASRKTCGDVYVNFADYSNARDLRDADKLVDFLKRARVLMGSSRVLYVTYGDVTERDVVAVEDFVDTFFELVSGMSSEEAKAVKPLGVSFDIEHFPATVYERVLVKAQQLKAQVVERWGPENLLIQCTIEGEYKPVDTDIIMKHADRALMMVYRNSVDKFIDRLKWFLTEQCERCLDDNYATEHYRAKISIMVETACRVGQSCSYISFCAIDDPNPVNYLVSTLKQAEQKMTSSGLITEEQKQRLFTGEALFVAHDFEWFQCFFNDSSNRNSLCDDFRVWRDNCKSQ